MALPKFIVGFNALSTHEKTALEKLILAYHDDKSEVFRIFLHIKKVAPNLKPDDDIASIKGAKFESHSDKNFANYLSVLYQSLEEWLMNDTLKHNNGIQKLLLMRGLQKRGLYQMADRHFDELATLEPERNPNDYYNLLYAWLAQFEVYYSYNPHKNNIGTEAVHILVDSYLKYSNYTAQLLKAEIINWAMLYPYKNEMDLELIDRIAQLLPTSKSIFDDISDLLRQFNLAKYDKAVEELCSRKFKIKSLEEVIVAVYLLRINVLTKKQNIDYDYTYYSTKLYDFAFAQGIFEENGKVPPTIFKNMLKNVYSQSLSEGLDFVDKYIRYVHTNSPESTKAVSKAQIYFTHGAYEMAIKSSIHTTYHDFNEKLTALSLHFVSFYMIRHLEPDVYQTTKLNYIRFIHRNFDRLSPEIGKGYKNFIKVISEIEKNKGSIDLSSYDIIQNRTWIVNYLKEHGWEIK